MGDVTRYKVGHVASAYGLDSIGDELVDQWTRETDAASLRELAAYFNKRVLQAVMDDAGLDPLDGEVENTYRLLTGDDVSSGVRTEARKRLERDGLDVSQVEADFVTYQAVRSYLQDGRGVSHQSPTDEERIESVGKTIQQLQTRTINVTDEKLAQIRDTGRVNLGQFRVSLELRVFCEDCGSQYEVSEFLDAGSCNCPPDT